MVRGTLALCLSLPESFQQSNLRFLVCSKTYLCLCRHFLAKAICLSQTVRPCQYRERRQHHVGELALHSSRPVAPLLAKLMPMPRFHNCRARTLGCRRHSLFVGARSCPVVCNAVVSGTRKWHAIEKVRWLDRHYKEEDKERGGREE